MGVGSMPPVYIVDKYASMVFTNSLHAFGLFNLKCCSSAVWCAMLAPSMAKASFAASDKEPAGSRTIVAPHSFHLSSKNFVFA